MDDNQESDLIDSVSTMSVLPDHPAHGLSACGEGVASKDTGVIQCGNGLQGDFIAGGLGQIQRAKSKRTIW